jgi:two-component system nitrogen regulation response regulator NtrX
MARERILVVDDEPGVRQALEGILGDEGFDVASAASGEAGLEALAAGAFDAVLLDIWLPGIDGIDTLVAMRERRIDAEVIMISGHGTIETAVRATKLGAFDFIEKPLSLERTLLVLRNALRQRRLEHRNLRLLEQLERDTEILGDSPAAARLRAAVAAAAGSDAPVLVRGEPGSGRETAARRIHGTGSRSGEPFVSVPCAALDGAAAALALFGEPGRAGRIALARRGTLFLEDADRMDPDVQARLAAQLGRTDAEASDVRVIGTASPDASGLAAPLRGRIEVLRVDVPPLRERRDDIPLMAQRFMSALAREYGRRALRLDTGCLAALSAHPWPGNVRDLKNLVERLLLTVRDERVSAADLPPEFGGGGPDAEAPAGAGASLQARLEAYERELIQRTLDECGGDRRLAAGRLGVSPAALDRRMRSQPPGR